MGGLWRVWRVGRRLRRGVATSGGSGRGGELVLGGPTRSRGAWAGRGGLRRGLDGDRRRLLRNVSGLGSGDGKGDGVVGTGTGEVGSQHAFKVAEVIRFDVELPVQVGAHLAFHLVDLAEGEHALANDAPRLVGVGVVADHLAGDHEGREEETVSRRSAGGREALLEALEQIEGGEGDRLGQTSTVEGVGDEDGEIRRGSSRGSASLGRVVRACKEVGDEATAELGIVFVTVILIAGRFRGCRSRST